MRGAATWILALASLTFTFALLEGGLRLLPIAKDPAEQTHHERPQNYYLPTDAASMRGNLSKTIAGRGAEDFRLAVVGDSFSFAPKMQFFDGFAFRLQRIFEMNGSEKKLQVVNYGSPGLSTEQELPLIEKAVAGKADLIILQITLNDAEPKVLRHKPHQFELPEFWRSSIGAMLMHSRAISFVVQRLMNSRSVTNYIEYYRNLYLADDHWVPFAAALKQAQAISSTGGSKLVVVLFPLFDFPFDKTYPLLDVHQKIATFATELGIPILDLRKYYRGTDPKRLQLIPGVDSHPNEIGHRIASEAIYHWLITEKLVPEIYKVSRVYPTRDNVNEADFTELRGESIAKKLIEKNRSAIKKLGSEAH